MMPESYGRQMILFGGSVHWS